MHRSLPALAALLASLALAACTRPARPTVSGADLYAQVTALRDAGRISVAAPDHPIEVRREQVLIADRTSQVFVIEQLIERCRGGAPELDVDCALALVRDQRFRVVDHAPDAPETRAERARLPPRLAIALVTGAIAVPLVWGVSTCDFPGCKAVFGFPLALDAGAFVVGMMPGLWPGVR